MFNVSRGLIVPTLITAMVMLCSCTNLIKHDQIRLIQKDRDNGQCEKAVREVDAAAGLSTDMLYQAQLAFLKAECLEQMGNKDEAQRLYQYLVHECSSSPYSYQAKSRLKALEENNTSQ